MIKTKKQTIITNKSIIKEHSNEVCDDIDKRDHTG